MIFIQLTDGLSNSGAKEYVEANSITNIMPRVERVYRYGFFTTTYTEKKLEGSKIYTTGSKYPTYIKESPEQVVELISKARKENFELTGEK